MLRFETGVCGQNPNTAKKNKKKNTVSCQARCRQRCWESAEPLPPTPQGAYRQCATNKPLIDSLAFFHPPGSKRRGPVGASLGSWWQHCQSAWVTHQITPASVVATRIWLRDWVFQLRVYYQALLSAVFTIQEGPGLKSVTLFERVFFPPSFRSLGFILCDDRLWTSR